MKISNETKVGAITAVAITILILGYNFMKGQNLFTSYNTFYAVYDDVEGLFSSNPVMVNGYKVGQVTDVEMNNKTYKLVVEIKVPSTIKVTKNSEIRIVSTDMIGSKGIHINMGTGSVIAKSGDTLLSGKDLSMTKTIANNIAPLTAKINTLLEQINSQIGDDRLKKTIESLNLTLNQVTGTVKSTETLITSKDQSIDQILGNINSITHDIKQTTPQIKTIVGNLETTTDDIKKLQLEQTINQLKTTLASITKTIDEINSGKGTLGKLTQDDALFNKLNTTLEQATVFLKDIEKYPRRYTGIFEKQRKKGDKQKEENKISN